MREIKFRAWDGVKMYTHKNIDDCDRDGLFHWMDIIKPKSGMSVMQFTGLKDKNGVEIYYNDIFNIKGINYYVEYLDDSCKYVLTTGKGYDTRNCIDLNCDSIFGNSVIGNIHENPELIK